MYRLTSPTDIPIILPPLYYKQYFWSLRWGLKKVPSGSPPEQVDFLAGQVTFKKESIRKLSNVTFPGRKTLYQNNFKHIAFGFTLFKGFKSNTLYEITPKKRLFIEPKKTNFKSLKFYKRNLTHDDFTCVFSTPLKFEIWNLFPWAAVRNRLSWCYYR